MKVGRTQQGLLDRLCREKPRASTAALVILAILVLFVQLTMTNAPLVLYQAF